MAVTQASAMGAMGALHHRPRPSEARLGTEFCNLAVRRMRKGRLAKKVWVRIEQEGHRRSDVRVRVVETAFTPPSSAAAPEKGSLEEIVRGDFPILNQEDCVDQTLKTSSLNESQRWTIVKKKLGGLMSNAQKQSKGVNHIRHSLGVDLGDARTGVAISLTGYAPRSLSVLQLKGDKLVENLLQIAAKERADEFIVGLPLSLDGKETAQSRKTRSFTGRLATQAAQRGLRVYLLDEYGSSQDGLDYMLNMGMKKKCRKEKLDAYAALVLLQSYFSSEGSYVKLIVPKGLALQERLCLGDFSTHESNFEDDFL